VGTPRQARPPNPCYQAVFAPVQVPTQVWRCRLPWKDSTKALTAYAVAHKHTLVLDRRVSPPRVTFDEKALEVLQRRYPADPLYHVLGEVRQVEKVLSTYIEGPFVAADGRVHGEFTHKPLTLRLSQRNPSLLNLPRVDAADKDNLYNFVRAMYVAAPGHLLMARDYRAIEAVLVGYEANDGRLIRVAKLGVHDYFLSHVVGEPADETWPDAHLGPYLRDIKRRYAGTLRDSAKMVVHASNYCTTPRKMRMEAPHLFGSERDAARHQDAYYRLFPSIQRWHQRVADDVNTHGYLTAPSGFRLHYNDIYKLTWKDGTWVEEFSEVIKEAAAAVPQHMGAYILMRSVVNLCQRYPEFRRRLRLLIHDEIFWECPEEEADLWNARVREVMEEPVSCLPCMAAWGMGESVSIGTEGKRSAVTRDGVWGRWADMQ